MKDLNKKINELMFNPNEAEEKVIKSTSNNKVLDQCDSKATENNQNDRPDLTTFDNRDSDAFCKLINNKIRGQVKAMPNKSMKNLNGQYKETLPIYKRRAKGPIKITDTSYNNRPLNTNYTSKREDGIAKQKLNRSSDENINDSNQNKTFSKSKSTRVGRKQSDFRINRNRTVNNRRNPSKSNGVTQNINYTKASSNRESKASIHNKEHDKRAQSQHNSRQKPENEPKTKNKAITNENDLYEEIQKLKERMKNNYLSENTEDIDGKQFEESNKYLQSEFTFQNKTFPKEAKNVNSDNEIRKEEVSPFEDENFQR